MGLIQIRNVPDELHRTLKARAAAEGSSLSDYLLREVTRAARSPTPSELDERIRARCRQRQHRGHPRRTNGGLARVITRDRRLARGVAAVVKTVTP